MCESAPDALVEFDDDIAPIEWFGCAPASWGVPEHAVNSDMIDAEQTLTKAGRENEASRAIDKYIAMGPPLEVVTN